MPVTPYPGAVTVDSFDGSNDSAKLRAAMTYAAAQTYKPALIVTPGSTFDAEFTPFAMYDGFKLIGGSGGETEFSYGTRVNVRGSNGVFAPKNSGRTQGVLFQNIGFEGSVSTVFITDQPANASGGYLSYSQIDSCSFDLFKHLYWGPLLGVQWYGVSYINNLQETALKIGGSDNVLFSDGAFLDQNAGTTYASRVIGDGLLQFNDIRKTLVGPIYTTCDPGLGVSVNGNSYGLIFQGPRFEGRNSNSPAAGAVVRVNGGSVTFRDVWAAYGMADPTATGRNDGGLIHVSGGQVLVDGLYTERAVGVPESVPIVNVTGGRAIVRNVQPRGYTGLPRVRKSGSGSVIIDETVQLTY